MLKAAYDSVKQLLHVHVVDNGKGIAPGERKRLFKAFSRVERTEAQNSEGLGMGLVICKHIVKNKSHS